MLQYAPVYVDVCIIFNFFQLPIIVDSISEEYIIYQHIGSVLNHLLIGDKNLFCFHLKENILVVLTAIFFVSDKIILKTSYESYSQYIFCFSDRALVCMQ